MQADVQKIDGPRLEPKSGTAKQLVVFLHGYGADGNDLIEIGRAWQGLLPDAAFVSPHAPNPCGQSPMGREWFPLTFRDPNERWVGVNAAAPALSAFIDAELMRRNLPPSAQQPVVLTTMEIRRYFRKLVELEFPHLAVLSYQELSPEMNIQPIARISLG